MKTLRVFLPLLILALGGALLLSRGDLSLDLARLPVLTPRRSALPPEFERLGEVYQILQADYVEQERLDPEVLAEGAIRGMLQALDDPYTAFIDAEVYGLQLEGLEGSFGGIGAVISLHEERVTIVSVLADTPAAEADIRADDVILEVNGASTDGTSLTEVILRIRGEEGTVVRLILQRQGAVDPIEVELVRDRIAIRSVESRPLSGGIPLLTLSTFSKNTGQQVQEVLEQMDLSSVAGIIIDLRNNTGGLLEATVQAVGSFLGKGVILYQVDKDGEESVRENAAPGVAAEVPLAVLVNRYSASASEVFAGAIQDHGRGPLLGERTFGKGSVGLIHNLSAGGGLLVTTARWLTPNRRLIEGHGLEPDIAVADDPSTEQDEQLQRAIDHLLSQSRA